MRRRLAVRALLMMATVLLFSNVAMAAGGTQCSETRPATPAAALQALLDGNQRWASGTERHPGKDFARRECVFVEGQTPYAAILSCSDSRVPPELLFDQGVGDIFVVRVAGNSTDKLGTQSLEYGVDHLGVEILMVLGHQNCGAVKAAVDTYPAKAPYFLSLIYAGIEKAKEIIKGRGGNPDDKAALLKESIDQHVIREVQELRAESPFKEAIEKGKLKIVGGRYDLENSKVTMLIE